MIIVLTMVMNLKINDNDSSNGICDRNIQFISHGSSWYGDSQISDNNNNDNINNDNNDVGKNDDESNDFKFGDSHFKSRTIINDKTRIILLSGYGKSYPV